MQDINRDDLGQSLKQGFSLLEAELARSYCPHSGLRVACGLLLANDELVTGVNYESASYGLTQCAERNAISRAQVEGKIQDITCVLLSACFDDSDEVSPALTPCGACRQWLSELSDRLQRDLVVYSFWKGSSTGLKGSVRDLLPKAFL